MPTYQYVCTECGEPLEVVQKFSDDSLTECPACGGRLRKVFSAAGIIFKGSGFYRTDSRTDSRSGSSNGSAGSKSSSDSGSSSSSDSGSSSTGSNGSNGSANGSGSSSSAKSSDAKAGSAA